MFNFDDLNISEGSEDKPGIMVLLRQLSKHCDAILHGQNHIKWGFRTVPEDFRVLEQKGCFIPNFYMVNPLYYIGIETIPLFHKGRDVYAGCVKDGAIFITISEDEDDLDNLQVRIANTYDTEIIESLPVVLFRRCRKPIGLNGICDEWSEDWSDKLNCKNDTSEFIGVFKAQLKEKYGNYNMFKMTKIFDRYYFDTTKIKIEK